jgi:hypothetical protein
MDIKDKVGIVTGVVGMILGIISLVRGEMLKRVLYWEPYFKTKWSEYQGPLSFDLIRIRGWLDDIEKYLMEAEKPEQIRARLDGTVLEFRNMKWNYDTHAGHAIKRLSEHITKLRKAINDYNVLREVTTQHFFTWITGIGPMHIYMQRKVTESGETGDKKLAEAIEFQRDDVDRLMHVAQQYTRFNKAQCLERPVGTLVQDIIASPTYMTDISLKLAAVRGLVALVRNEAHEVAAIADIFNAKFSRTTEKPPA